MPRAGVIEQLQNGSFWHSYLQALGLSWGSVQSLSGESIVWPVEELGPDITRREPLGEPGRYDETGIAPKNKDVPRRQVVAYPLKRQRAFPSDVQASHLALKEAQRAIDIKVVVRECVDAMGEAYEPASLHIAGSQLW
ncbi:hypothetical protein DK27_07745 [Xanthomonas arboricola pv. pruni]|nr:hypothetical protein DK27_07745 [Xanthomonas arboricola pv. pruni]